MFREMLHRQEGDEAYVESQIERQTTYYFEAARVKAEGSAEAKEVFVRAINEKFGIDLWPAKYQAYAELTRHPGWWRCCIYWRGSDSKV